MHGCGATWCACMRGCWGTRTGRTGQAARRRGGRSCASSCGPTGRVSRRGEAQASGRGAADSRAAGMAPRTGRATTTTPSPSSSPSWTASRPDGLRAAVRARPVGNPPRRPHQPCRPRHLVRPRGAVPPPTREGRGTAPAGMGGRKERWAQQPPAPELAPCERADCRPPASPATAMSSPCPRTAVTVPPVGPTSASSTRPCARSTSGRGAGNGQHDATLPGQG